MPQWIRKLTGAAWWAGGRSGNSNKMEKPTEKELYESNICLYCYRRNQNAEQFDQTGTTVIWKDIFSKNTSVGTTKYESTGKKTLEEHMEDVYALSLFSYSFQIPRLGREFDLLQIKEARQIVKLYRVKKRRSIRSSCPRTADPESLLSFCTLGKPVYSYTYISSQGSSLFRLDES